MLAGRVAPSWAVEQPVTVCDLGLDTSKGLRIVMPARQPGLHPTGNAMPTRLPDDVPRRALIEDLAGRLARHPAVDRVWLFGSRARGDNFERSDIDLAIEAPSIDRNDWLKIKLDFEDEAPTLLLIDLVRFEDAPEHLREQIRDEGIVVYERARAQAAV